ncbi:MAG: metallophosphoesterase [Alphaproteobacteria bacterium]|nr:metallophosphoesterase [Alphaproteobacteria bacterium]
MTVRHLVQVTDTHLSRTHAYFVDNWEVFVAEMQADPPDLIVWTGDVSLRGSDEEADLAFARGQIERLPVPVLVLPGNHDIGDPPPSPRLERPVTEERLARWERQFGPGWWAQNFAGWRLYGLNAQIFGSGLEAEAEQYRFFESALADGAGRPGMLFTHKPVFYADPEDPRTFNHAVLCLEGRQRILDLCRAHDVRVIASGHLHYYRTAQFGGIDLIWAPATAFINSKIKDRPHVDVERCIGYLRFRFDGATVSHTVGRSSEFTIHDLMKFDDYPGSTHFLPPRPLAGADTP